MITDKEYEELNAYVLQLIKNAKLINVIESIGIVHDVISNLENANDTLKELKEKAKKKLNEERNKLKKIKYSGTAIFERNKKSNLFTQTKRENDPLYKEKNNKDKRDSAKRIREIGGEQYETIKARGRFRTATYRGIRLTPKPIECILKRTGKCLRKGLKKMKGHTTCPLTSKFCLINGRCHRIAKV